MHSIQKSKYLIFSIIFVGCFLFVKGQTRQKALITIHYNSAQTPHAFVPAATFGVAFDGHEKSDNDKILRCLPQMFSVDMKLLSYRLRTELGIETWHWNPKGTWSDPSKQQGYWTSSSDTASFISLSYGYRLPRRGNTRDQANNDGYSRIDDGDTNSFWKSNPYLDTYFTNEPNEKHAQWIIVDLGKETLINTVEIVWGNPYAVSYTVDYARSRVYDYFENGGYFETDSPQLWKPFPNYRFNNTGTYKYVRLSKALIKVRFIRIRMTESSETSFPSSNDIRDKSGFSIKEIYVGKLKKGKFTDYVHHSKKNHRQSQVYVSSTDPWHRATDIDTLTEQIGIDKLYTVGLNRNLPALLSAGLLYDTPENVFAFVDYVNRKKYSVAGIELGEEPDGQMISPEDAGELYNQFSKKIKQHYPLQMIGGPSLQGIILNANQEMLPTKHWMERYVKAIQQHNKKKVYDFFSFEWYPYDNVCAPSESQLLRHTERLHKAVLDMKEIQGLQGLPFYITEYGYSAFAGISEVSMQGALMNADIVGEFLTLGGNRAYLYGWEPNNLQSDFGCAPGNNMLFGMDDEGKIIYHTATYYGAKMITRWARPFKDSLKIYLASANVLKQESNAITAYALQCPDNSWSLLLINKNESSSYEAEIQIEDEKKQFISVKLPLTCYQYSGKQYQWKSNGLKSHPVKELPPEKKILSKNEISLPPYSLTVIKTGS